MSIRGGRGPRDSYDEGGGYRNGYQRTGRYGRGPGDQRRYERYGSRNGGVLGVLKFILFLGLLAGGVLLVMVTVARPLVRAVVVPWADDNPAALRIPFVEDMVREDLGSALTDPAGGSAEEVTFLVQEGDTVQTVAPRLAEAGLITSERAFLFVAREEDLASKLRAGRYGLAGNLTPAQVVDGLVNNRIVISTIDVSFREQLRLEQMTAKLQVTENLPFDPADFYKLVTEPTDALLGDYPWLLDTDVRPKGASLEGFLYPATYTLRVDTENPSTAEDLVRAMLDTFADRVGEDRLKVPEKRGLTFYEVLTLASIVDREAVLDEERPTIAGVYQNRIDRKPQVRTGLLEADPTVIYAVDTDKLGEYSEDWQKYVFWTVPDGPPLRDQKLPKDLDRYNTYKYRGLPPGPIASPTVESIDAALKPDTKSGYKFFVAIPDSDPKGKHDFSKTLAEHERKLVKYGYN
ncbi:MAG TPA: endolytic transglycosylase MltG [Candidatus Limnocylindrales bacterium]|nr:endolytic transglycosylase MltG [Candidatus Limnocylindrales bacterium]